MTTCTRIEITENESFQDQVMERLKFFHHRYGEREGEIERQRFHE